MANLFDIEEARRRKAEGMARAKKHAHREWYSAMIHCGLMCAEEMEYFNTDQIYEKKEEFYPDVETHEKRAMGPVMKDLQRHNVVLPAYITKSERPVAHRNLKSQWKSLTWSGRNDEEE
jgi:hypothetical protein